MDDERRKPLHWTEYLKTSFAPGRETEVTITVDPDRDSATVLTLASRLRGLVDALRTRETPDGPDPLQDEDVADLLGLLDQLHRVRMLLQGQEERVMLLAHERGASLRSLASRLTVSGPQTVANRLSRIREADRRGSTAAALDEG